MSATTCDHPRPDESRPCGECAGITMADIGQALDRLDRHEAGEDMWVLATAWGEQAARPIMADACGWETWSTAALVRLNETLVRAGRRQALANLSR